MRGRHVVEVIQLVSTQLGLAPPPTPPHSPPPPRKKRRGNVTSTHGILKLLQLFRLWSFCIFLCRLSYSSCRNLVISLHCSCAWVDNLNGVGHLKPEWHTWKFWPIWLRSRNIPIWVLRYLIKKFTTSAKRFRLKINRAPHPPCRNRERDARFRIFQKV